MHLQALEPILEHCTLSLPSLFKCCQPPLRVCYPLQKASQSGGPENHSCLFPAIILFMHRRNLPSLSTSVTSRVKIMYLLDGQKIWSCVNLKGMTSAGKAVETKARRKSRVFPVTLPYALYLFHGCSESLQFFLGRSDAPTLSEWQAPCFVLLVLKFKKDTWHHNANTVISECVLRMV